MNIPKHYNLGGEGGPLGKEIVLKYYNIEKNWNFQIEKSSLFITNYRLLHETLDRKMSSIPHDEVEKVKGTDSNIWYYGTLNISYTNGGEGLIMINVGKKAAEYLNSFYTKEVKEYRRMVAAKFHEKHLNYPQAIELYIEMGKPEEAARVRKLKAEQGAVKVDQTIVHGDYVDDRDTIVKDSVINRSNIGNSEKSKSEELREAKALLDDGIIDDAEFKQMKKEILDK